MIYILTFHRALNYGAILQCYGLYKTIDGFVDCKVLDYRAKAIEDRYKIFGSQKSLKGFIKSVILLKSKNEKKNKFNKFTKNYLDLSKEYDLSNIKNEKWDKNDIFIVGSDQVWNVNITENDYNYFLEFVKNRKKISYAASVGIEVDENLENLFTEKLEKFKAISVRETSVYRKFNDIGILCEQCIDPVFLLTKENWYEISKPVKEEDEPFVLVYMLQKSDEFMKKAVDYAKKANKKLVILSNGVRRNYDGIYIDSCGPDEFIRYFLKASVIFTNSFHGISFSILFKKEFYFEFQGNGSKTNSRLKDIIEMFDLESQNISGDKLPLGNEIDYININKIICEKREKSIEFLRKNILGE